MTSHRDTKKRRRPRVASADKAEAGADTYSAQIIRFNANPTKQRPAPKPRISPALENLLGVLRTEVAIAIGINLGLNETLVRFQGYLTAIDNEIACGEILQLGATLQKQTAHLRATVLEASADLRRVLPDSTDQVAGRADRSDLIYS